MNNRKDLGLLNYEGDVLKMKKAGEDEFVIYDQWNSIVEILTQDELFEFLDGIRPLTDSSGKTWNWADEHREAKTSLRRIFEYIKS
jgi:hypothetical protein